MLRILALLMLFVSMALLITMNIAANALGRPGFDPLKHLSGLIERSLKSADDVGPELARQIEQKVKKAVGDVDKDAPPAETVALIAGGDFAGLEAPGARYAGRDMSAAVFLGARLDEARLDHATAAGADFRKARMAKAVLTAGYFPASDFSDSDLSGARARAGEVRDARFAGADLTAAAFSGADLTAARLEAAYAPRALFREVTATGAAFTGADLRGAIFEGARLAGASFKSADIALASFAGADIKGADFTGAQGGADAIFQGACADERTVLPEGVAKPDCGAD